MLLREKDRLAIIALAEASFSSSLEIWAYGSRVNGDAHESSDLDLVIRGVNLQAIDTEEFSHFVEALRESNIPILVQVFDWFMLPETFHRNILKKHEILFSK
ncbi:nucleotidyltransferase domain-containing protein [Candidatus Albibeggiatoa sp. nov. BB20]|uniref:nucleotidyltransferase domain-containing protein n=1 Tax=Candidatus Albibeggiatoa sp. nov. BB20 TaxID=3162723 RepID=UPI0033653D7E